MPMDRIARRNAIGVAEFDQQLRTWLDTTDEQRVGVGKSVAWIHVRAGRETFRVNADTQRSAVQAYLRLPRRSTSPLEWHVVPTRTGEPNAVGFGPERRRIEGFNAYLK